MINLAARKRLGWIISQMTNDPRTKHAAVMRAEAATKGDPFKILVFTMLSARTKDAATLEVVERLFRIADTPEKVASLNQKKLESILYGVGFYHVKAKHLIAMCRSLQDVPDTLEGLLALPGVGRKTANIVLARAFGKDTIGVDVHVNRISNRLGIVSTKKPEETEKELLRFVPKGMRRSLNRSFVAFGQTVCLPRNPKCPECPLNKICYKVGVAR